MSQKHLRKATSNSSTVLKQTAATIVSCVYSCRCQPEKREPSYSRIAAMRMGAFYTFLPVALREKAGTRG